MFQKTSSHVAPHPLEESALNIHRSTSVSSFKTFLKHLFFATMLTETRQQSECWWLNCLQCCFLVLPIPPHSLHLLYPLLVSCFMLMLFYHCLVPSTTGSELLNTKVIQIINNNNNDLEFIMPLELIKFPGEQLPSERIFNVLVQSENAGQMTV